MLSRCIPLLLLLCGFGFHQVWAKSHQTREAAAARHAQVEEVAYSLFFQLGPDQPHFSGRTRIEFVLRHNREPLVIDFSGKSVDRLVLDGKEFSDYRFDAEAAQIILPATALTPGPHLVELETTGTFTDDGVGLMRYVDEEDQRTYLYTDFEPQEAHRAYPCFDQPDLKATFHLETRTPADWTVISNTPVLQTRIEDGAKVSTFKRSKRFSTYLFHLSAGPYASWHDPDFRYPLGLYCRQSLAKYLDAPELLEQTRRGFDFFEHYFDYPYPFEKYDQIFCPDYPAGAMENVGAVTWSELFIPKRPFSERRLLDRRLTLWHEMAHQWFGDLVTMKWWDNLWLNESFATYMSYVAAENLGEKATWEDAAQTRNGAISTDLSPSTHPVLADVPDVDAASSIFDSITYGKGFCVLRQLDRYLGGTTFRDGLRIYFRNNAWKNTGLNEFASALEERHGKDLDQWLNDWLGTTGVNGLQMELVLENGKIAKAFLHQTPSTGSNVLREHATLVGLFYRDEQGKVNLGKSVQVLNKGKRTEIPELVGEPAPELALPNVDRAGYSIDVLDARSLDWLKQHFSDLSDDGIKSDVFNSMSRMVFDAQWDAAELISLVAQNLTHQTDVQLVTMMTDSVKHLLRNAAPSKEVAQLHARRFFEAVRPLPDQTSGELQKQWIQFLDACAEIGGDRQYLTDRFAGKVSFKDYELSSRVKWRLLAPLLSLGVAIDPLMANLESDDSSESTQVEILKLNTMKQDLEGKRATWKILVELDAPNHELRAMAEGFATRNQADMLKEFIPQYFEALPKIYASHGYGYLYGFGSSLWPDYGESRTVALAHEFLKRKDLAEPVRRLVMVQLQELEKRLRIRQNWGKSLNQG